ncbi:hypothetical protein BKA70DRAFT_603926 [Coprinopsis sp. MPI-PUGE-AT-0042]|nr:hypothetical protein BKA70DRAFT_603926 [Coprinopsis sp. MPI-PUGE-AT-0042]
MSAPGVKTQHPLRKNRNEAFLSKLSRNETTLSKNTQHTSNLSSSAVDANMAGFRIVYGCNDVQADDTTLECTGELISFDDASEPMEGIGSSDQGELSEVDGTEEAIQGLIAPIQKLTLVCGSLMTYGSTAVYRFRPVVVNKLPTRFPKVIENPKDAYILLVEGADKRCYNPSFEWNRYLPKDVPLTRLQHDKALDLMFKFCLSWCLRIIPTFFLRDMCQVLNAPADQKPPPQTAHYSPMLHNVLVALALNLLDDPVLKATETKELYIAEAKKYIDKECGQPNLSTVHALSTLGTYHSSQGDQTLGFMYFGMSARVSQALGLDVDCSEWIKSGLIEESDVLDRYWTFWTIFAQDVNWSLYVGRDFCVRGPTESDFKDMPVPFCRFGIRPDAVPSSADESACETGVSCQRTFASACELLVIARRIMAVVNWNFEDED